MAGLNAPDMRRVALALGRLGLDPAVAGDLGLLGDASGEARIEIGDAGWRAPSWRLAGRFGVAEGSAEPRDGRTRLQARVSDADLTTLIRPAAALLFLAPGRLSLDLSARRARLGASPPGEVDASLARDGGVWTVMSATAGGFDGVRLSARRDAADALAIELSAQRADAVAAVAERLAIAPEAGRLLRALRGVSPLSARGAVRPQGEGWTVDLAGSAGALAFTAATRSDRTGVVRESSLSLESADRGLLFRALGLPEPAARRPARVVIGGGPEGVSFALTGEDGLSVAARAPTAAGPFPVTLSGPASGFAPPGSACRRMSPSRAGPWRGWRGRASVSTSCPSVRARPPSAAR